TYPSVQTFTIQSAFKYDHAPSEVQDAIARLVASERGAPIRITADPKTTPLLDKLIARYEAEVRELAPIVNAVSRAVPRRRLRKLHVGLFGYSRGTAGVTLPRAIPFCASLYSLGVPPELIGLAAVSDGDWAWLRKLVPTLEAELRDAMRFFDVAALGWLPEVLLVRAEGAIGRTGAGRGAPERRR